MLTILLSSSTWAILLTSLAIYSCIPLKAIQYYIKTATKIDTILKKLMKDARISEQQYDYLKPSQNPRERRLYFLPKIHKNLDKWPVPNKMPPGRPIV